VVISNINYSPYLYTYSVSGNITKSIPTPGIATGRIAKTSNRLWIENGSGNSFLTLKEYVLVENPYNVTLNRSIDIPRINIGNSWNGLFAINNTQLIGFNTSYPSNFYSIDITTTTGVNTFLWSTASNRGVISNSLYTTSNKVIFITVDTSGPPQCRIEQRDYTTGVQDFEYAIGSPGETYESLFTQGGSVYTIKIQTGEVYRINPTNIPTLTLVGTTSTPLMTSAAQTASCIILPTNPASWP
jgi:hypothetical protein